MEDRFIVLDNHKSRSDTCFLEILDGCHGVTATETIVAKLPLLFLEQLSHIDSSHKNKTDKANSRIFCQTNQGRLQEKREEPSNEKTNKTSLLWKCMLSPFGEGRFLQLGRNEVPKVHWSGGSARKRIPREEMDGTKENILKTTHTAH